LSQMVHFARRHQKDGEVADRRKKRAHFFAGKGLCQRRWLDGVSNERIDLRASRRREHRRLRKRRPVRAPLLTFVAISLQTPSEGKWSGWPDSNRRPPDPQSGALARLRYIPM
jgi:hypothetical protein